MAQKTRRVSHGVAVSTLFSAIALLYGTAAYGSYYPGHVEPGGNGFDIPGFNGDVVFNIDPGCVTGDGWHATNANPPVSAPGCGAASVYSATIDLYSTAVGPFATGPVLDSFTLGTSAPHALALSTFDILGVLIVNGLLAGIDTNPMGPVNGSSFYSSDQFWLQFVSGACLFGCTPVPPPLPPPVLQVDPAYIFVNSLNNPSPPGTVIFGQIPCDDPNNCRVAAAPEPGTLALILGALGGGWLAKRRKKKAAEA